MASRACGAFEVSASLKNGVVDTVTVVSHKGHTCRFQNPWPREEAEVIRFDGRTEKLSGDILEIQMQREEGVRIHKA